MFDRRKKSHLKAMAVQLLGYKLREDVFEKNKVQNKMLYSVLQPILPVLSLHSQGYNNTDLNDEGEPDFGLCYFPERSEPTLALRLKP